MSALAKLSLASLATASLAGGAAARGYCNIRECGCPPYRQSWCDPLNSRVFSPQCQRSAGFCEYTCGEDWCGGKPPPKPPTPPPKIKVYHQGTAQDNICYQTNYTDPHYVSLGYKPGFCPFQLVDDTIVTAVCNGHSEENTKYCPGSVINITVYKMGKS